MFNTDNLFALANKVKEFTDTYQGGVFDVDISKNITVTIEANENDIADIDKEMYETCHGTLEGYEHSGIVECEICGVMYRVIPVKETNPYVINKKKREKDKKKS